MLHFQVKKQYKKEKGFKCIISLTAIMLLLLNVWSCKKDGNKTVDKSNNEVKANVQINNATAYDFNVTGAAAKINALSTNQFQIEATDVNKRRIFIYLRNITAQGTYAFTSNDIGEHKNALWFTISQGSGFDDTYWTIDPSIINKGSVTITLYNAKRLEGSFIAVGKNNAGIVANINGSFKGNF
jgi:competence protein ComGC